jgi:hypothetical protein
VESDEGVGSVSTMMRTGTTRDDVSVEGLKNDGAVGSDVSGWAGVAEAVRTPDSLRMRRT